MSDEAQDSVNFIGPPTIEQFAEEKCLEVEILKKELSRVREKEYVFTFGQTMRTSNVRIHVERAIRRVKGWHIFDQVLPLSMAGVVNQVWTVCCLVTNWQAPALTLCAKCQIMTTK